MKLSAAAAAAILAFASALDDKCKGCPAHTVTVTETAYPSSSLADPVSSSAIGVPHPPGRPHHFPHHTTIVTKIPVTKTDNCTKTKTYVSSGHTLTTTYETTTTSVSTITKTITIPLSSSGGAFPTGTGWYSSSAYATGYSGSSIAAAASSSGIPGAYPSSSSYGVSSSVGGAISSSFYPSASSLASPASSSGIPGYGWSSSVGVSSSIGGAISSSAYPSVSSSYVHSVSGSSLASPASSSAVPSMPACWTACFDKEHIKSEHDVCGNTAVDKCIHDTCSPSEDKAYWSWYNSYCTVSSSSIFPSGSSLASPASSSGIPPVYSSSSYAVSSSIGGAVSSSIYPSSSGWSIPASGSSLASPASSSGIPPVYPSSSYAVSSSIGSAISSSGFPSISISYSASISGSAYPSVSSYPASFSGSSSIAGAASSSLILPPITPSTPPCWTSCYYDEGVTSEKELCGNTKVDECIHRICSPADDKAYWTWYDNYCGASSSSLASAVVSSSYYPSGSSLASPESSSAFPGSTSSAVVVSSSSAYPASSAYPSVSASSFAGAVSSSVVLSSSALPTPSTPPMPNCWSSCFDEAGIKKEHDVCGNTKVDRCIHRTCSPANDHAYWSWYDSYCNAGLSSSLAAPASASSASFPSSSSVGAPPVYTPHTRAHARDIVAN